MDQERPYQVFADATGTAPLEMFKLEEQKSRLVVEAGQVDLKDEVRTILADVPNWLPLASEVLGISPSLKDYILIPTVSMPSDLPNRNGQSFPYEELTKWMPEYGCPMFHTWNGMPMFLEHSNNDPTKALGIILKTIMRPIKNTSGDIWKVIKLGAVDRNRDSVTANKILTKQMTHYSMGAYARDYQCNYCGSKLTSGGCEHVEHGRATYRVYDNKGKQVMAGTPGGKLAYYNVVDPKGFELSVVKSGAYASTFDTGFFTMDNISK